MNNPTQRFPSTAQELLPKVYEDLRTLAKARIRKLPPGQTIQPTALVHEAYLRLVGDKDPGWSNQRHFFASAAQAMRDILVDQARKKTSLKRGGNRKRLSSDLAEPAIKPPSDEILAVDEAVKHLEKEDVRKGQIVNLRYFARMTTRETAAALNVSVATIEREWRYIRAWLECRLQDIHTQGPTPTVRY
ncbi:MAG: sigma-70 family RNA polymerase sigma factor [Planctomycetes bacterium]|nr:sigma-70 family RNA polymerase sigma factor [Planctomycetota bacterium]